MAVLFHFGCGLWCGSQLILLRDRGKKRTLRSSRTEQHMAHLSFTHYSDFVNIVFSLRRLLQRLFFFERITPKHNTNSTMKKEKERRMFLFANVNWKVRFRNKTWLTMFISLIVGFVFNILRAFDISPVVTESLVMNIAGQILTLLGLIGVIVDPTTAGVGDSERALGYEEPWEDK